jgi:hypothetical protein
MVVKSIFIILEKSLLHKYFITQNIKLSSSPTNIIGGNIQ